MPIKCPKCNSDMRLLYTTDNRGRHVKEIWGCICGERQTKRLGLIPDMTGRKY